MLDHNWIESMQDELNQFKCLDVWELVERPIGRNMIVVKWIWKKKTDAENTVIQNKSPLVAKGYGQEGDPNFPNHVYRLKKALYGLKQAPRAWYDMLSSFLIKHHFTKGILDPTLFKRRHADDILLVQIYVDNINFGSTNQVHQSPRGIFIYQSQYTLDLLKKHGMEKCDTISTPMATAKLDAFTRQTINMGLWYSKDSGFELIAYSDADHAGCNDDYRSTSGDIQFMGDELVSWSSKKQDCTTMSTAEAEYVSLSTCCAQVIWMRTQLLDYEFRNNKIPCIVIQKEQLPSHATGTTFSYKIH
ncbi:retrovirus-related pol polyprotein from transposon TNT 1-94 [Tanacetum coccineum]